MRPPSEFGADITNQPEEEAVTPAMMICTRLAGRAIIRVVGRCNEAQENNHLDLSECQLMQVPDAVYHLMRNTDLESCNLSGNSITKIPPKFAFNFTNITELNLSRNHMSKLPDELEECASLEKMDISHNSFISLPEAVYKIPKLAVLKANNNCIIELDVEMLERCPSMRECNIENNPLTNPIRRGLDKIVHFKVSFSLPDLDDD